MAESETAVKKPARKPRAKKAPAPETFTLEGVSYDIASIPEGFKGLFADVGIIERKLQDANTLVSIIGISRQTVTDKFKECLPDLTVIPEKA